MRCLYIIILLLLFSQKSQACYEAELLKVYPVGFSGDTIISVDARIYRLNAAFLDDKITGNIINEFKAEDECDISELGWLIKTYITKYDKSQNIIESMPLDSARFYNQNVEKQLRLCIKEVLIVLWLLTRA